MIGPILKRTPIDHHTVSHFVSTLRAEGRYREACRIVVLWLEAQDIDRDHNPSLYEVGKLAREAPRDFAHCLLPHFLALASQEVRTYPEGQKKRFSKAMLLPWDWDSDRDPDKVLVAFCDALNALAAGQPELALPLIRQLESVEIDEVQEVIAQTFIAGGATLAHEGLAFLLADERRFQIGDAHVRLEPGCSSTESGLTSQELVAAISQHLDDDDLIILRDRIENWSSYKADFGKGDGAQTRLDRIKWAGHDRMKLLERLPDRILPARRARQIREWRASSQHPIPQRALSDTMATFVGSPMSQETMTKARDEDIVAMLDDFHDAAPERSRRRPVSMDGGVTELSRAFGAFAKENPERAISLCRDRFKTGRHEHASAALVDELSKLDDVPSDRLLLLIHDLSERGFASRSWKTSASWALARLAGKLGGLPDETITMLESWLENDPAEIAGMIERRLASDARNESRNGRNKTASGPVIFSSHRMGSLRIIPQHNYSVLDAMFHGLINREDRAFDQWLAVLERHALRAEDPHVWTFILLNQGRWLSLADKPRTQGLLARLWQADERVFLAVELGGMLWSSRGMVPQELMIAVIKAWFASPKADWKQAAAELMQAFHLVEPLSAISLELAQFQADEPSPELTGRLFAAACAWRESDINLRKAAHGLLMQFIPKADGNQADAISSAVDKTDTLQPDQMTKELILEISRQEPVLRASLTGSFADALQSLLLYPGFDEPVMQVTERIAKLLGHGNGKNRMHPVKAAGQAALR